MSRENEEEPSIDLTKYTAFKHRGAVLWDGWLQKGGGGILKKSFYDRYFILRHTALEYYNPPSGVNYQNTQSVRCLSRRVEGMNFEKKGEILLSSIQNVIISKRGPSAFLIETEHRVYPFQMIEGSIMRHEPLLDLLQLYLDHKEDIEAGIFVEDENGKENNLYIPICIS